MFVFTVLLSKCKVERMNSFACKQCVILEGNTNINWHLWCAAAIMFEATLEPHLGHDHYSYSTTSLFACVCIHVRLHVHCYQPKGNSS